MLLDDLREHGEPGQLSRGSQLAVSCVPFLPGAAVLGFAFASGGFLPGPVALGVIVLAALLLLRVTLATHPWGALSIGYVAGATALALLAGWTLLSAAWSGAPARAITEYDRVLLYLLGFLVVGAVGRTPERLRSVVHGIAAAAFVVCLCALTARLAPDVWRVEPSAVVGRLSYPVGYWNALGLLAAIGAVMTFGLTSDARERPGVRVVAAAALPILGTTLLLTFSRGAIAAAALALILLIAVGRPRALLTALLVGLPAVAAAVATAYGADVVTAQDAPSAEALAQHHEVAWVVVACSVLAGAARAALLPLDRRMQRVVLPSALRRPVTRWTAAGGAVASVVVASLALGVPGFVSRQYDRFVSADSVAQTQAGLRGRLTDTSNSGRVQHGRVALRAFRREPVLGQGAGTYALEWDRHRPATYQVEDAHSLYIEILGELGIVGLVLVLGAILLVLAGFAARARGPDRMIGATLFAAAMAWAVHAGVDWDWEMPVVTFWIFAAGGLALAAPADMSPRLRSPSRGRVFVALGCLLLAMVPARVALSERPLRESARAFVEGDCARAVDRALDANAALGVRPEPFILLGYCNVRLGQRELAVTAMLKAVNTDPRNWEGHYGLALVRAAAGEDPRPALRTARRLNPREPLVVSTTRLLGDDPRQWRTRALRAQLPAE